MAADDKKVIISSHVQTKMDVNHFYGHCVMLPFPDPLSHESRKAWFHEICSWLEIIQGDYSMLMIRQGATWTKEDLMSFNVSGLTLTEQVLWFFSNPQDAMLFKLRWA